MNVLVTGFTNTGVSIISQSLKQDEAEGNMQIISHELTKDKQLPERIEVGNFIPELVIVVTDSNPKNVENSYSLVKLLKRQFPNAYKIAIVNTQNLPETLQPERIEELLGLTTYVREQSNST